MKVLVACEYSGRVRTEFEKLGHNAWSCDLLPTEIEGQHYEGDVRDILYDGWDLMVAHPDCTYLTNSAAWAYKDGPYHQKIKEGILVGAARRQARKEAIEFVEMLWDAPIDFIAIENPIGCLSTQSKLGKPTQYIQPYEYGEDASKKTCLWLKNLPKLEPTCYVEPRMVNGKPRWGNQTDSGQNKLSPSKNRAKDRSLTYMGWAKAMAEQWG